MASERKPFNESLEEISRLNPKSQGRSLNGIEKLSPSLNGIDKLGPTQTTQSGQQSSTDNSSNSGGNQKK